MNQEKYKKASEAAAALAEDPKLKARVEREVEKGQLVTTLIKLRLARGVSQTQIAQSMGCDPSKVSRLEAGDDFDLKLCDIVGYLKALNLGMSMLFDDPSLPAAVRIKHCVYRIHDDLESLASLAKQVGAEDGITKKIHEFFGQVLFNFMKRYEASYKMLPSQVQVLTSRPATKAQLKAAESAKLKEMSDQIVAA